MEHVLAIIGGIVTLTPMWTILFYKPFKKADYDTRKKMLVIASLIGMAGLALVGVGLVLL